ncbi:MAG: hypothetical protein JWQ22_761 [Devosia sp.]|nr:hypothetical protein [Devosia sp.]
MPGASPDGRRKSSLLSRGGGIARRTLFWVLTLAIAIASWRWMLGGVAAQMEQVLYHEQLRPIVLYTHIILAPLSLLLVPFQLWQGLRKTRPLVHRVVGRTYGVAILFSSITGLWLAVTTEAGLFAAWGFGMLAVAWFVTTAMGISLAMRGDYAGHRRWIIRSVAMTLAAVTLRLYIIPTEVMDFSTPETYQAIAWLCWVPNMIVAELYLRWPKIRRSFQPSH